MMIIKNKKAEEELDIMVNETYIDKDEMINYEVFVRMMKDS